MHDHWKAKGLGLVSLVVQSEVGHAEPVLKIDGHCVLLQYLLDHKNPKNRGLTVGAAARRSKVCSTNADSSGLPLTYNQIKSYLTSSRVTQGLEPRAS